MGFVGKTLIAVAQRAKARLFLHEGPGRGLTEIADLVHPESRAHGLDLDTDRPGRVHDRVGTGRHAMANEETHKERAASDFAREIARALSDRRTHEGFDRLILAAEPGFLGLLRAALDDPTKRLVDGELPKELTHASIEDIAARLEGLLVV